MAKQYILSNIDTCRTIKEAKFYTLLACFNMDFHLMQKNFNNMEKKTCKLKKTTDEEVIKR